MKAGTRKWLKAEPPTKTDWMDIVTAQGMERIYFILNQIYRLIINSCGRSSM